MLSRPTTTRTDTCSFYRRIPRRYGNVYADMITGNMTSYNEANFNRLNDISYNTVEFFGQDSWKATEN